MPIIISSDYIASIEESASVIESEIGTETVESSALIASRI